METHRKLSDIEFEQQFEKGILDPSMFSHEAHLRLAWIHVSKYGLEKACTNISSQIMYFVKVLGKEDKFNKTVTIAAIKAVYHFMQKSTSNNFPDFIQEFPRLKFNFQELLGCHYGFDIFNLKAAKGNYLEPDLLPFE